MANVAVIPEPEEAPSWLSIELYAVRHILMPFPVDGDNHTDGRGRLNGPDKFDGSRPHTILVIVCIYF